MFLKYHHLVGMELVFQKYRHLAGTIHYPDKLLEIRIICHSCFQSMMMMMMYDRQTLRTACDTMWLGELRTWGELSVIFKVIREFIVI